MLEGSSYIRYQDFPTYRGPLESRLKCDCQRRFEVWKELGYPTGQYDIVELRSLWPNRSGGFNEEQGNEEKDQTMGFDKGVMIGISYLRFWAVGVFVF